MIAFVKNLPCKAVLCRTNPENMLQYPAVYILGEIIMRNGKGLLIASIIMFIIPVLAIIFMRDLLFSGVVATYEEAALNQSEYEDKWISYEVIACLGEYAEETETHNFIETGHSYYYVIWMADGSIMPMSVSKKEDREYLDALTDATYDYVDGKTKMIEMEPRTFVGTVKNQKSEAVGYYNELLNYLEISEADGWVIRYTLLDCTSTRLGTIGLVAAVTMIPVLGIVASIVSMNKNKKKYEHPEDAYLPR